MALGRIAVVENATHQCCIDNATQLTNAAVIVRPLIVAPACAHELLLETNRSVVVCD